MLVKSLGLIVGFTLLAATAGCGSSEDTATAKVMPDVIGQQLDDALSVIEAAGIEAEVDVDGGGLFGIVDESNWRVCDQTPGAGAEVDQSPRLSVDRSCGDDNDEVADEPVDDRDDDENEPEPDPIVEDDSNEPEEAPAFDGTAYVAAIEDRVVEILGVEINDACDFNDLRWHCFYDGLTGRDSPSRVDVHLGFPGDISDAEQREYAADARLHLFNFVGEEYPELLTIVSYNSNGLDIGTTRRDEVLLLRD
ncbi:PASTA domain-containing protein [Actinospongicola halichondriae]|uniref:PASTA domain-containing protein n=1 Tax=Actinospongicola halichondriae TaxID=3236844 RepID=UPI003D513F23